MEEEEEELDDQDVERAQTFWSEEDVDQVFRRVVVYLDHLKRVLKDNTASDRELVQALKLLEVLDLCPPDSAQDTTVVQVVIGAGELLPADPPPHSPTSSSCSPPPPSNGLSSSTAPPAVREELLPPLEYQPHACCKTCLSSLPRMPQYSPLFWGQNPLKVPLLCGFKRLMSPLRGAEPVVSEGVVYKAPCGQSLHKLDDVMRFLLATESYDVLQVDFFTFNPSVQLDPPVAPGPRRPELDLSRGVEPTPVELCTGDGGTRPADFRYRRDRWPHGCFLSRGSSLFSSCCDCVDGCTDAQRCACVATTRGGRRYSHHRLTEPVATGLYECGPWCGCDRARCQNRLVQRGIRVRLQVFQTDDRGWGVRCRDDLDRGTFVCIYAGVILKRVQALLEPSPPKLTRCDLPSDDEVEVVTEWLAPPVLEGRSNLLESPPPPTSPPTSPPLHVPVIQRPLDANAAASSSSTPQVLTSLSGATEPPLSPSGELIERRPSGDNVPSVGVNGFVMNKRGVKREAAAESVCVLDASREGNVSRFINHSCDPNLFVQSVFTDSHDDAFPVVAFFTSRTVKAGTELTWDYSAHACAASSIQKQEVTCLCGSDGCRGRFAVNENMCDVCEVKGQGAVEAQ
ncbi:histone-lysine N-methyltransferase SETDB2 isoform X2 [Scophthalmus maximus]|uniref:histone-lysine N-methyltransferase SETDB2 isoform X2 n=1 Tax=Scophthalmus maximus TaxID=52904 RepID=UPI001FA8C5FB|nr:histone-lysine N-methyltransferase SETDB2 isoform X2 [Scophthalmus maximus]